MANLDYSNDNIYLGQSMRAFMQLTERQTYEADDSYINLFEGRVQEAVRNNVVASAFGRGWSRFNKSNVASGIAPRLLELKVSKTFDKVAYQCKGKETELESQLPTQYLSNVLKKAGTLTSLTGRCLMVVYADKEEKPFINCYSLYRHKIQKDSRGKITDAKMFLCKRDSTDFEHYVIEHRFYDKRKGLEVPLIEFVVGRFNKHNNKIIKLEEVPEEIKEEFKDITFNRAKDLSGFTDLGVYPMVEKLVNLKYPDYDIPETMFNKALDNICMLEAGMTAKEVEKEIGRGQVLVPEFQKESFGLAGRKSAENVANAAIWRDAQTYKNPILSKYPTKTMEDSKPQSVQFDIRASEWEVSVSADIARLCSLVGISVLDYDPRLLQTGQRTDDEINAMTDITANTVKEFREINEYEINRMLECVGRMCHIEMPVGIRWSMASIMNPTKNAQLVISLFNAGLISRKEAIKRTNPDLNENEIEELYNAVEEERKANPIATQTYEQF